VVEKSGKLFLRNLLCGPGEDVVDTHPGIGVLDGGLAGGGGTRKDLHFHTCLGQCGGQFTDVHVHAAGIAGTRLLHGGGVEGQ